MAASVLAGKMGRGEKEIVTGSIVGPAVHEVN